MADLDICFVLDIEVDILPTFQQFLAGLLDKLLLNIEKIVMVKNTLQWCYMFIVYF